MLAKITRYAGSVVPIPGDDIDTDRIIPARYLRCVTFDGLGPFAFYDERFEVDGSPKQHPLNEERFSGASIIVSGRNFGCGSSREHAPQSLHKAGIRAILAESFAEIFFGNSTTLGMICVTASSAALTELTTRVQADPSLEVTIDLNTKQVSAGDFGAPVDLAESARDALINGRWDPLGSLLESAEAVAEVHSRLPYIAWANG